MEGVMMKNQEKYAVAVRKPDQEIVVETSTYEGLIKNKKIRNMPILRGVFSFIESLDLGQVAELDAGPRLHGRDQLAERRLCRKILQGLEAAALVEDVGCVAGRDHKAMVGGLSGAYSHEVLAAGQPKIPVGAAESLQAGGFMKLQLRPLHVLVGVVPLRPDQRHQIGRAHV